VLGAVLLGCATSSPDPTLNWTAFEPIECEAGSQAAECFRLRAEVDGQNPGEGRCDVVAVGKDGSNLFTAESFGPLELAPGGRFEWTVELPEVDDPQFSEWVPECTPQAEG
jgi:hypothetical protein